MTEYEAVCGADWLNKNVSSQANGLSYTAKPCIPESGTWYIAAWYKGKEVISATVRLWS